MNLSRLPFMVIWWPDMRDLMRQLRSVLEPSNFKVYEFDGDPAKASYWNPQKGDEPWLPEPETPVLIATDLGLMRQAASALRPSIDDWLAISQICHQHRVPLVALVPVDPGRWPQQLSRSMDIIHWDPARTANDVKRSLAQTER